MDRQAPARRAAQGLASQLRLPLAAAVLGCVQAAEGRESVWHAEQGDRRPGPARGAGVASQSFGPGQTSMGTLRTGKRRGNAVRTVILSNGETLER